MAISFSINKDDVSFPVTNDLDFFKSKCDLIVANRFDENLEDIESKVFTRDIYGEN